MLDESFIPANLVYKRSHWAEYWYSWFGKLSSRCQKMVHAGSVEYRCLGTSHMIQFNWATCPYSRTHANYKDFIVKRYEIDKLWFVVKRVNRHLQVDPRDVVLFRYTKHLSPWRFLVLQFANLFVCVYYIVELNLDNLSVRTRLIISLSLSSKDTCGFEASCVQSTNTVDGAHYELIQVTTEQHVSLLTEDYFHNAPNDLTHLICNAKLPA